MSLEIRAKPRDSNKGAVVYETAVEEISDARHGPGVMFRGGKILHRVRFFA